jgi:hypothetical protein
MKIKNFYLTTINIILFNLPFYIDTTKTLAKEQPSSSIANASNSYHPQMPMITENELKEIMQNAIEEYNRMPEEEKELMSKQIGIKREDLDDIMKEASAFVEEINTNNKNNSSDKTIESNTFNDSNTEKTQPIQKKNTDLKNETKEQILIFEKAIKTLQTLNLKTNDQLIREKILTDFDMALISTEKIIYYFLLIKQFLSNNENQILISPADTNSLINIAHKINALKDSIEKLITLNEYEAANNKNNLFEKYSIKKKSNAELKNFLENEITTLKNKIKEIEAETTTDNQSKKEKSKKIINIEYKIDILETDLTQLETTILESKKNNNQFEEYQKLLYEALDKIIKNLKNIFLTDNAIGQIEEIIRKYFPEEYKIGKQKEEHLKKQINNEKKIKEQKGSNSEMHIEKNIKHSSVDTKPKNQDSETNNNFQSSSNNNEYDYENDNQQEEQSPFDFPKHLGADKPKDNQNNSEKEKEAKDTKNNSQPEKENKKYRDLRHPKEDSKSEKTETKNKESEKGLNTIENKLKSIYILVNNFINENSGPLYSQWKSEAFAKKLEEQITELQTTFTMITPETIKEKGKKNIFVTKDTKLQETGKKFIEPNEKNKEYINEELEKIEWLDAKLSSDSLPQAQLILYQLKDINEILIKTFKNKGKREEKDLKTIFPLLEQTIDKFKKGCVEAIKNENIPYWLLTKTDIEKKMAEKKTTKKE